MIFITVGTTHFPFVRMERIFRDVCRTRKNNELVVFQHGVTPVTTGENNATLIPYMDFDTTNRCLHQARVVICHGGPATVYQALSYGKVPCVLPREKQFGEHVDDHQVCFCNYLNQRRMIYLITKRTQPSDLLIGGVINKNLTYTSNQLLRFLRENTC